MRSNCNMQRGITREVSPFLSLGAYLIFSLSQVLRFCGSVLNPFVKPFQYRSKGPDYYWSHGPDVSTFLVDQMLLFLASSLGISSFLFRYSNILWYCYINDFTYFPFFPLLPSHCLVLFLRWYSYTVCESPTTPYPYPILWHWLVGVHAIFLLYSLCIIHTVPSSYTLFAQLHYTCSLSDLHSHYTFCLMGTLSSYQY